MRRVWKAVKGIFSYAFALALIVVFALYLSGRTGWFFFAVMVIYPVSSAVIAYFTGRFLTAEAEISQSELYKGDKLKLRITIKNRSYLPSPPVAVDFFSSEALGCENGMKKCTVSVMPRSEHSAETEFTANIWCACEVGVKRIVFTDFTGLMKFPFKTRISDLAFKVNIIPNIADVPSSDPLIRSANDASSQIDDSEETRDDRSLGFNGTPGYEHREYVPGDPLKRINWKLSCKKDMLMVRLDDEVVTSRHTIVLDAVNSSENIMHGECCGENMLGILMLMVRMGIEADVWYYRGGWKCCEISDENSVEQLRFLLAGYEFVKSIDERVPMEEINLNGKCSSLMFFTPCFDADASGQLNIGKGYAKTDTAVTAAAASVGQDVNASGVWLLSESGNSEIVV